MSICLICRSCRSLPSTGLQGSSYGTSIQNSSAAFLTESRAFFCGGRGHGVCHRGTEPDLNNHALPDPNPPPADDRSRMATTIRVFTRGRSRYGRDSLTRPVSSMPLPHAVWKALDLRTRDLTAAGPRRGGALRRTWGSEVRRPPAPKGGGKKRSGTWRATG